MNHRQDKELEERERRRELILMRTCTRCKVPDALRENASMNIRSPKYMWFTCERCGTTTGVQRRIA